MASAPPDLGSDSAGCRATRTVLVVDDSASICELVRQTLSSAGYLVLVAVSGNSAIRLAEQHEGEIHLLLTDLTIPDIIGEQVAQAVSTLRPAIKVLYMSGHPEDDERVSRAMKSGAGFMQKPFSIGFLRDRVQALLH